MKRGFFSINLCLGIGIFFVPVFAASEFPAEFYDQYERLRGEIRQTEKKIEVRNRLIKEMESPSNGTCKNLISAMSGSTSVFRLPISLAVRRLVDFSLVIPRKLKLSRLKEGLPKDLVCLEAQQNLLDRFLDKSLREHNVRYASLWESIKKVKDLFELLERSRRHLPTKDPAKFSRSFGTTLEEIARSVSDIVKLIVPSEFSPQTHIDGAHSKFHREAIALRDMPTTEGKQTYQPELDEFIRSLLQYQKELEGEVASIFTYFKMSMSMAHPVSE